MIGTVTPLEAPAPKAPRIKLMGVDEIFAALPPIPYLLEALDICPGAVTLTAGLGFSAKTLIVHALGLAVACGAPAWGAYPVRQGKVLFLDYEQGQYLTRRRIQRMARGMGLVPDDGAIQIACMPRVYLDDEGGEENPSPEDELTKLCRGVTLVVIDSLAASCPDMEENAASARKVLDMLGRVSEATGCVVIIIHHARKPSQGAEGGPRAAIRGSGALFDACGTVICTERQPDGTIRITHEKARMSGKLVAPLEVTITDTHDGGLIVAATDAPPPVPAADRKIQREQDKADRNRAQIEQVANQLLVLLTERPGLTGRQLEDHGKARTGTGTATVRAAVAHLVSSERVATTPGPNRSTIHMPVEDK